MATITYDKTGKYIDNRDQGTVNHCLEARVEVLVKRVKELEQENQKLTELLGRFIR